MVILNKFLPKEEDKTPQFIVAIGVIGNPLDNSFLWVISKIVPRIF